MTDPLESRSEAHLHGSTALPTIAGVAMGFAVVGVLVALNESEHLRLHFFLRFGLALLAFFAAAACVRLLGQRVGKDGQASKQFAIVVGIAIGVVLVLAVTTIVVLANNSEPDAASVGPTINIPSPDLSGVHERLNSPEVQSQLSEARADILRQFPLGGGEEYLAYLMHPERARVIHANPEAASFGVFTSEAYDKALSDELANRGVTTEDLAEPSLRHEIYRKAAMDGLQADYPDLSLTRSELERIFDRTLDNFEISNAYVVSDSWFRAGAFWSSVLDQARDESGD